MYIYIYIYVLYVCVCAICDAIENSDTHDLGNLAAPSVIPFLGEKPFWDTVGKPSTNSGFSTLNC